MGKLKSYYSRCRTCLKKADPEKSQILTPDSMHEGKTILKMLNFCIPELIIDLNPKPSICKSCLKSLYSLYKFKNKCLKTNLKFKKTDFNESSKRVPSTERDIHNDTTVENIIPNYTTKNYIPGDLETDVNQNKTSTTNHPNTSNTVFHKENPKRKVLQCYRKRFTNSNCFGCQNRIRDVRYHSTVRDKNFMCLNCGKQFTCMTVIRKHIYDNHIYLHKCKICGKKWRDAYSMAQHLRSHTKEKPFECPECGKKFVQSHNLNQHLAIHNKDKNNQNRCEQCGKILSTKYNLKIHMMTYHNVGTKPRCSRCNKWFYTEAALEKHVETCVAIKEENEIFITEPEFIKTEVPEYFKEDQSDDDVFIEETSSQSVLTKANVVDSVKEESVVKLETNDFL